MQKMERFFHDDPFHLPQYVDLRDWQDDKTVLRNPHKGWYWHYIDNGFGSPWYRDTMEPGDWLEDFPGLNHLYLRFDWGDIEPEEGSFRFDRLDSIMESWGGHGYRFSMRVCTFESATEGPRAHATPDWVYKAGAKYTTLPGGMVEPDYGDPVFLDKLGRFMRALGARYNGHPLLETVDVGTYGTWGEGHTSFGSEKTWPLDTMKAHIDLHALAFPDTYILLNDDHINQRAPAAGQAESAALLAYAKQLGLGLRDDSVSVRWYADRYGYDTLRTPYMFDHFWRDAPIDLELQHFQAILDEGDYLQAGLPFLEAMRRTHTTFAGFHGYPRPWLALCPDLTAYCANRLGYWYFIEGIQLPPLAAGAVNHVHMAVSNRGFAPGYHAYKAILRLTGDGYTRDLPLDIDNRRWMPGETVLKRLRLDLRGIPAGTYDVSFGLFDGDTAIALGMSPTLLRGPYYHLGTVDVEAAHI